MDATHRPGSPAVAPPTQVTGVHVVAVPVTDVDRALSFYTATLGLRVRMDATFGAGQRWVEVVPDGAATGLALVAAQDGAPTGVDTGIRLASRDAAADHAALRAAGADVDDLLDLPGAPLMFVVRDPDGNRLVVVTLG